MRKKCENKVGSYFLEIGELKVGGFNFSALEGEVGVILIAKFHIKKYVHNRTPYMGGAEHRSHINTYTYMGGEEVPKKLIVHESYTYIGRGERGFWLPKM